MDLQTANQLLLKQRITPLINRYEYFTAAEAGSDEQLVAFVEQKRFKLKEEITAWTDTTRAQVVFGLKAEKVVDVRGRYWVRNEANELLGSLRKVFGRSLWRSTWEVYDAHDQPIFTAQETSRAGALIRRLGGLVPVVGDLLVYWPFNFEFRRAGAVVGHYNRVMGWRDHYKIDLGPELAATDRRLVMALGIALDALQSR